MLEQQNNKKNISYSKEYYKIKSQINKWALWKKKAYNTIFATSKHAKKIPINDKDIE